MASGRVGGTRSKIRGQVGGVIYQVVKNPDGSYSQIEYGKPGSVVTSTTPKLQAQRMCTCMVEALMRDLAPVGRISMQSGANKSKSLNAFSSFNLQLVGMDCKTNWYENNQFYYPDTSNIGRPSEQLGGLYMLSSGTWQFNGFDEVLVVDRPEQIWADSYYFGKRFAGFRFDLSSMPETVDQFLRRHYMSRLDSLVFACFHDWNDSSVDPDDPTYVTRHSYVIATINPAIPSETLISTQVLSDLFLIDSDWETFGRVSDNGLSYYLGLLVDNAADAAYFYTYGGFTISWLEGKKKISPSSFKPVNDANTRYFLGQAPADVFGSWVGEPSVKPYPSPFI